MHMYAQSVCVCVRASVLLLLLSHKSTAAKRIIITMSVM